MRSQRAFQGIVNPIPFQTCQSESVVNLRASPLTLTFGMTKQEARYWQTCGKKERQRLDRTSRNRHEQFPGGISTRWQSAIISRRTPERSYADTADRGPPPAMKRRSPACTFGHSSDRSSRQTAVPMRMIQIPSSAKALLTCTQSVQNPVNLNPTDWRCGDMLRSTRSNFHPDAQ